MTTVKKRIDTLRAAVEQLANDVRDLSQEEREDRLIDIGCVASEVDLAALDIPPSATKEIKAETDALVERAEIIIRNADDRDVLAHLATRVRKCANKRRL